MSTASRYREQFLSAAPDAGAVAAAAAVDAAAGHELGLAATARGIHD